MTPSSDETALADDLRRRLGPRHPVAAIATVASGVVSAAVAGAPASSTFELGSVSKGLTGLLYADAVERGEVTGATRLGDLLPLGGSAAANVTLAALSTHTSGLPRLPAGFGTIGRTIALWRRGANPYGDTLDELLAATRSTPVGAPRPRYSNLGFELLGHAVAAAAGRSFRALLHDRLAEPLGLESLYAPASYAELDPGALRGRSRGGRQQEPWTGEAIAPAGGMRATIADTAALAAALLDGSAPGVAALEPVRNFTGPAVRIGAAWVILERKGRRITWHNGGTGGFRTWLGLDREAGTAAVLLSATARSVDRQGFELLDSLRQPT